MKLIGNQADIASDVFRIDIRSVQLSPTQFFRVLQHTFVKGGGLGFRISKELVRAATFAGNVFGFSDSTLHYSLRVRKPDLEELEGKRFRLWTLTVQCTASKKLVDLSGHILHKQQADFTGYNRRD